MNKKQTIKRKIIRFYNYHTNQINRYAIIIVGVIVVLCIFSVLSYAYSRLRHYRLLNKTVVQITQLINNTRTIYDINNENVYNIPALLNKYNVLPPDMYKNGQLYNLYDGKIIISPSTDIIKSKNFAPQKTFKLSYQNLSYETCVSLASLDWGNNSNGYLAEAAGNIKLNGYDSAYNDIDAPENEDKIIKTKDKNGKNIFVKQRAKIRTNVSTKRFSIEQAKAACFCENKGDICSFALRYIAR